MGLEIGWWSCNHAPFQSKMTSHDLERTSYYHQATFLQSCLASSILPQTSYFFLWYFLFRCTLNKYEFFKIFIAWWNWHVTIYTAGSCCLILKALSTIPYHIFYWDYIPTTSLYVLYAIYKSWERSEQSCQSSRASRKEEENSQQPYNNFDLCSKCVQ